ncbi:MAG: hypothetical protein WCF18_25590 [Chthoniobacteraceae bacterium]
MPTAPNKPYRQLPGSGGSALQRHRLWLGADHVLSVASSAISERYRRFYFADIQAIVWRPTAARWWRALSWLVVAALCALGLQSGEPVTRGVFASIAAVFLIFAVVDLALGKTCTCFVKTAVQFERLPSLRRQRTVEKVLAQLRPLIAQAQPGRGTAPGAVA